MATPFVKIEAYGQLNIDKIFFETDYPILFTCINEKKDLFLCVCCQNNQKGKKWLINKTSSFRVLQLLRDEITIRQILTENPDCRITVDVDQKGIRVKYNDEDEWGEKSIFLPKEGVYLEADPGEFEDEIQYYKMMEDATFRYNENFSQNFSGFIENAQNPVWHLDYKLSDDLYIECNLQGRDVKRFVAIAKLYVEKMDEIRMRCMYEEAYEMLDSVKIKNIEEFCCKEQEFMLEKDIECAA